MIRAALDLVLVGFAVWAALVRTPVGDLALRAVDAARGLDRPHPALTSWFLPAANVAVADVARQLVIPTGPVPAGGLPTPWRAVVVRLPETLPGLAPGLDADGRMAALDALAKELGSPEAAFEVALVGRELYDRGVARARSAGEADAATWTGHRRYLPDAVRARVDGVLPDLAATVALLDLGWPIVGPHRVSSPFGMRFSPILHVNKLHEGVDLAVPIGTPVYASQAGVVKTVTTSDRAGLHVVIDHGGGVRTSYLHMSRIDLAKGDRVLRGQPVGLSGNTGRSTGPHLHFGLRVGGKLIDPLPFRRDDGPAAP